MRSRRLALVPLLVLVNVPSAWSEPGVPGPALSAYQREERELPVLPPPERLELPPRPTAPQAVAAPVTGGPAPEEIAIHAAPPVPLGWVLVRLLGATVAVAGLLVVSLAGYRRLARPRGRTCASRRKPGGRRGLRWLFRWAAPPAAETDRIEVLGRSFLGPRESICVVRVGRERFLLGVTPAGVGLLSRLDAPDRAPAETAEPQPSDFARELRRVSGTEPGRSVLRPPTPVPASRSDTADDSAIRRAIARSHERVVRLARAAGAGEPRG